MTEADLRYMESIGLVMACDLRSNSERRNQPNRLSGVPSVEYWSRDHDRPPGDLQRLVLAPDSTAERTRELMRSLYRSLPFEFQHAYRAIFLLIAACRVPLVFNCAAGKDRTGVMAALLLTALGVPRAMVMADYLLTEAFFEQCCNLFLERRGRTRVVGMSDTVWHPMLRADASYLDAMFCHIESLHGSTEAYLRDALGVDRALTAQLRERLLED